MCHVDTNVDSLCIKIHIFNSPSDEVKAAEVAVTIGLMPEN